MLVRPGDLEGQSKHAHTPLQQILDLGVMISAEAEIEQEENCLSFQTNGINTGPASWHLVGSLASVF